jgi:glycine cleavage system transcriptional repressor
MNANRTISLVSILCQDRVGLVSTVAGCLFDLGINLGDATFAAMGRGAEFRALCEMPDHLSSSDLEAALRALPELHGAQVSVIRYGFDLAHGPANRITHRIEVGGGDQPGLIARLSEIFMQFDANIVRLDAQKLPADRTDQYVTRFAVALPRAQAVSCLAAVQNTAGNLGLSFHVEEAHASA